jgi:hypothetical protein
MTLVSPPITSNSVISAWPGGTNKVVLLATNAYPASDVIQNLTYEFNGSTENWVLESPTSVIDPGGPLPPRSGAVMSSFDGTNLVLFGGNTSSALGVLGDTWLFESGAWSKATPTTSPSNRCEAAMAYLAGTGAVLFGGALQAAADGMTASGLTAQNDTWVFASGAWTQVSIANGAGPSARSGHAMAASGSLVALFGGSLGGNQLGFETWSFNGTAWTKLTVAAGTAPAARSGHCMVYDGYGTDFVMFGGFNSAGVMLEETWTLTISGSTATWIQVPIANGIGPSARVGAQMAFDTVSDRTILFGGVSATTGEAANDTWSFNAVSGVWTKL